MVGATNRVRPTLGSKRAAESVDHRIGEHDRTSNLSQPAISMTLMGLRGLDEPPSAMTIAAVHAERVLATRKPRRWWLSPHACRVAGRPSQAL